MSKLQFLFSNHIVPLKCKLECLDTPVILTRFLVISTVSTFPVIIRMNQSLLQMVSIHIIYDELKLRLCNYLFSQQQLNQLQYTSNKCNFNIILFFPYTLISQNLILSCNNSSGQSYESWKTVILRYGQISSTIPTAGRLRIILRLIPHCILTGYCLESQ